MLGKFCVHEKGQKLRGRALYAEPSRHEPSGARDAGMAILVETAAEKFNVGCVVRDLGTHGPLWAFVESLESSKI